MQRTIDTPPDDYAVVMPTPADSQHAASHSYGLNHDTAASRGAGQSWPMRFRVIEFSVSIVVIVLAFGLSLISVEIRDIPRVEVRISETNVVYARDPTIDYKERPQQVTMVALGVGTTLAPIAANLFINFVLPKIKTVRLIPHDTRDFLLSLLQSIGISQLLTQFMKNITGGFRPCFYDMCKWNYDVVWDGKTNLCQDKSGEKEARKSFPSGHASYAWCTLFLLTLYLLGRSRINCANRAESMLRGGRKILKLFLCFLPTLVATWISITRSVDNWHHYIDIVAGSIIGAFAAGFGYNYNYGSIFHWESAGLPYQEFHVRRKKKDGIDDQDVSRSLFQTTMELDTDARSV